MIASTPVGTSRRTFRHSPRAVVDCLSTPMESRGAIWAVAIPLIAFKIWFAILLFSYAPHADTVTWIAATHWPLVIIVVILIAGPGVAIYRLMRVRAKRER